MKLRLATIVLAAFGCLLLWSPATAWSAAGDVTLKMEQPPKAGLPYGIAAVVRGADGAPVAQASVRFTFHSDLLGGRQATLGTATTDTTGTARVPVSPRRQDLAFSAVATYGDPPITVEGHRTLRFPASAVAPSGLEAHSRSLLAPVREVMPPVLSIVVALLWLLFLALAVRTVVVIRRGAATRSYGGVHEGVPATPETDAWETE